ncbi:hypothetical protein ABE28_015845 [Peribacillus muralis]|uniref:Uncharacterized protein n=1 Tax=Peribacillus muralis TaxID=264697 RepID=A0A1B3XRI3_9BACI|nr:hypothetical protein ABE28_015845 [Peribacillus muralis]
MAVGGFRVQRLLESFGERGRGKLVFYWLILDYTVFYRLINNKNSNKSLQLTSIFCQNIGWIKRKSCQNAGSGSFTFLLI